MKNKNESENIRQSFIKYFKDSSHTIIESSNIVPENDDTLLFTNAGMVQFKKWFTGEITPKHKNVATIQKCIRAGGKHNDLDNVGFTPRHHTFFEMLGNFSFGGYFKEEAIFHAWTLLTKKLGLNKSRIIITVFSEDNESFKIWKKITGYSDSQIIKIKTEDNFWSMGDEGPCGPCSEIFYDNGSQISGGLPGTKNQDGNRFIEIWNLVFMEFEKKNNSLKKLPGKFVDTGMGLERLTAVLNDKTNNYDTDLYLEIIKMIINISNTNINKKNISSFRIISDHIKSIIFLMSEGVLPSNEGRGYVLRRIIRRALLHCSKINNKKTILSKLLDSVIEFYEKHYYALSEKKSFIYKNLANEEEKFSETLINGLQVLNKEIKSMKDKIFSPEIAFKLYDTYGFPYDMTKSILFEKNIVLNDEQYEDIVKKNKEKQKEFSTGNKTKNENDFFEKNCSSFDTTKFIGYEKFECISKLEKIIVKNKFEKKVHAKEAETILIFDKTPFYAESGGQVGDSGSVFDLKNNLIAEIKDTKVFDETHLHFVDCLHSNLKVFENYNLSIDIKRRKKIRNNHTATHLLHQSLREVLGDFVSQKGSLVNEHKLRFDYTSNTQLTDTSIEKIETIVNNSIRSNISSEIKFMPIKNALKSGAIALFGEKYPENVRVISIKGSGEESPISSTELCGGTHVDSTGQIGFFKIINDTSISSGVRRIEAITGDEAENYVREKINLLDGVKNLVKANDLNLVDKLKNLKDENSKLKKSNSNNKDFFSNEFLLKFNKTSVYYQNLDCSPKELRNNSDKIKSKLNSCIIIITCVSENKVSIVVSLTNDLLKDYDSTNIIKKIVNFLGGNGGGGRKDLAQGGAPLNNKLSQLNENLHEII